MAEHFSSLVPTIEKEIGQKFPTRHAILKEAFEAHVQGKYNLSIPVILAQADGIGIDTFGVSPYSRRKDSTDSLRRWIEVNLHAWEKDSPYLWVIADLLPINCSIKATEANSSMLNRHAVLHGLSSDYGTWINSCKALSWLLFVADFAPYHSDSSEQSSDIT